MQIHLSSWPAREDKKKKNKNKKKKKKKKKATCMDESNKISTAFNALSEWLPSPKKCDCLGNQAWLHALVFLLLLLLSPIYFYFFYK
jgi:hypothetical protein